MRPRTNDNMATKTSEAGKILEENSEPWKAKSNDEIVTSGVGDIRLCDSGVSSSKKEFIFVGNKKDFKKKRKAKCSVNGRDIAIFYHDGNLSALDHHCYHAGGPLSLGDIEDIEGRSCIVCPYHKYKITLDTGEGLYYSFNPKDFSKPPKLCSKGIKQRVHHIKVIEDDVYVALSDTSEARDSDYFNSESFKATMTILST